LLIGGFRHVWWITFMISLRIGVKSCINCYSLKVANLFTVHESPVQNIYEVGLCLCS